MDRDVFVLELTRRGLEVLLLYGPHGPLSFAHYVFEGDPVVFSTIEDGPYLYAVFPRVLRPLHIQVYTEDNALVYDGSSPTSALIALDNVHPKRQGQRHRVVQKTCRRCGATSTGGVYCPSGCGRV